MDLKNSLFRNWKNILIVIALFLLTFYTRFYKLSETAIYPDEITWMVRGKETALAIKTKNFNYFKTAWWTNKDDTESIALPLTVISGYPLIYLGRDQSVVSRNLLQDYIAARLPIIIFTSIFMVIYYFSAKKYFNQKVAFLSSFLLALDPLFVANSKLVMNDIFLTVFTFISVSSFLLIKNKTLSVFVSSLATASAFLTKPNGLIIFPILLVVILTNRVERKENLLKLLIMGVFTFIFISLIWPASWNNVLYAIPEYLYRQNQLVSGGINNFFLGKITNNPPVYYYVFQLIVRIPIIIILSLMLSIFLYLRHKKKTTRKNVSIAWIFIILFLGLISISAKKLGVRYALPVFPWIYLLSSYTITTFFEKVKKPWIKYLAYGIVLTSFAGLFIYLFPHNDLYYNSFVGASKNASKYDLIGKCQGTKQSVDYILKCYPEVERIAGLGCGKPTAAYYYPHKVTDSWVTEKVFYVESYVLQLKYATLEDFGKENQLVKIIDPKGYVLAYVFAKPGIKNICVENNIK